MSFSRTRPDCKKFSKKLAARVVGMLIPAMETEVSKALCALSEKSPDALFNFLSTNRGVKITQDGKEVLTVSFALNKTPKKES